LSKDDKCFPWNVLKPELDPTNPESLPKKVIKVVSSKFFAKRILQVALLKKFLDPLE
jgi:hypothetical protein